MRQWHDEQFTVSTIQLHQYTYLWVVDVSRGSSAASRGHQYCYPSNSWNPQVCTILGYFIPIPTGSCSHLCLALVKSCSAALLAISGFSSVRFIDAAHKGQRDESLHPYLTCVTYFNFALGAQSSIGFYGTDKAFDFVWERWISNSQNEWVRIFHPELLWLITYEGLEFLHLQTRFTSSISGRRDSLQESIWD